MLKTRVIPTLLWKGIGLVKGIGFDSWRGIGTVMPALKIYNARDVDELILLDISATPEFREPDFDAISDLTAECFVPLTFGGGVRSVDTIRKLLCAGADKVAINTVAYENTTLVCKAANMFGSQCVVASIDARRRDNGSYECYSHSGTRATGRNVVQHAQWLESQGAGEILVTSIDRDGTMKGYDLELVRLVTRHVRIPVIASGGAGRLDDFVMAVRDADASAVAAASIFHFTEHTPAEVKVFMAANEIRVRSSVPGIVRRF
ncbi:MAG TPA: imidazole glycerol phosphate synthase cyclase subunit [Noviherbaspirillum sp.]|nr:imidazole glycerol phosphate synthase cyclase subunit [Noviherbaspirillum sp.]